MAESILMQRCDGVCQTVQPIEYQPSPVRFQQLLVLSRVAVINESAKSMLPYKVGDDVANTFGGIRGPDWRKVLMLDHPCAFDIHLEVLFERIRCFWVAQRKSPANVDFPCLLR